MQAPTACPGGCCSERATHCGEQALHLQLGATQWCGNHFYPPAAAVRLPFSCMLGAAERSPAMTSNPYAQCAQDAHTIP